MELTKFQNLTVVTNNLEILTLLSHTELTVIATGGIITDCTQEEIFLRHAMLEHATRKVFLCDSSKLGKQAPYVQCDLHRVDALVSETDVFRPLAQKFPHLTIIDN